MENRFGLFGKIIAKEGQRDVLVQILLEGLGEMPGNELYIISKSATEPDALHVFEVWKTEADHAASLKLERVQALIARAKPLIAGFGDSVRMMPTGGKGLPTT